MKMKLWDRMILRLGGAVTLLTGILSLAGGFVIIRFCTYDHVLLKVLPYAMIGFGTFCCFDGVFDMVLPRRYHPRRRAFISQPTEHGELRIAVSAIENLILRCVGTHKEVKVLSMQITNRRGTVAVELCVSMNSNISIPHAVEQIQTQVKRYIAASSGIELREIRVSVEKAEGDDTVLPVDPLPFAAGMAAAAASAAADKEEVSMHQRVFGRDTSKSVAEQVVEAEVIIPPEEELQQEMQAPAVEEDAAAEEAQVLAETVEAAAAEECEAEAEAAFMEEQADELPVLPEEELPETTEVPELPAEDALIPEDKAPEAVSENDWFESFTQSCDEEDVMQQDASEDEDGEEAEAQE